MKIRFMQVLLGLMMLAPSAVRAADGDKVVDMLVLRMTDESTKLFALSEQPVITLGEGKFTVTSGSIATDYDQQEVAEYYFEKVDSATADSVTAVAQPALRQFALSYTDNSTVSVTGTKAKTVRLYTQGGQLVATKPTVDGAATLSLAALRPGLYLLQLENEHTFKLIKK